MTLQQAYSYSVELLNSNEIDEAEFKALCIVCHIANIKNSQFRLCKENEISEKSLVDCLGRLISGEPLQYILGKWDFYESEFYVGEGVLIPRPETEELVEKVISYVKNLGNCLVYDLCAGSGCIGVSIAKACTNAKVILVEKSGEAFKYLEKNCYEFSNATPILADINNSDEFEMADVIVSNPPYINSDDISSLQSEVLREPVMALDGGKDGLDFYRIIADKWFDKLKNGGTLFLEIGNEQGEAIKDVLTPFSEVNVIKDMYGNDRMVVAIKE